MRKSELIKLRNLVNEEIEKRKKINQCLNSKDVLEYLNLIDGCTDKKDLNDIKDILKKLLKNYKVTDSNGIYVCTKAYDEDNCAPITYYYRPTSNADHRCYKDIETEEEITTNWVYGPGINEFESSHIVLNPYNASYNDKEIKENGFEDVRLYYFEECYKHGQNEAFQKVLIKYPRIGTRNYR